MANQLQMKSIIKQLKTMSEKQRVSKTMSIGFRPEKRHSQSASDTHDHLKILSPEEMENIKLNDLRLHRKELQQKLMKVSNRINYRKKKQEEQLRKFFKSQQKQLTILQTKNYKKFTQMLKDQISQKKQFEIKKKAKEIQDSRMNTQKKLNIIYQNVKDRKLEQSQKIRHHKKIDQLNLKQSRQMIYSLKRQQCDAINRMKQRQSARKRCYWYQKRMTFQQKLIDQAQIYQKQIENYYKKIQVLKQSQDQLRQQEIQAQEILRCAQRNLQLLKQS